MVCPVAPEAYVGSVAMVKDGDISYNRYRVRLYHVGCFKRMRLKKDDPSGVLQVQMDSSGALAKLWHRLQKSSAQTEQSTSQISIDVLYNKTHILPSILAFQPSTIPFLRPLPPFDVCVQYGMLLPVLVQWLISRLYY